MRALALAGPVPRPSLGKRPPRIGDLFDLANQFLKGFQRHGIKDQVNQLPILLKLCLQSFVKNGERSAHGIDAGVCGHGRVMAIGELFAEHLYSPIANPGQDFSESARRNYTRLAAGAVQIGTPVQTTSRPCRPMRCHHQDDRVAVALENSIGFAICQLGRLGVSMHQTYFDKVAWQPSRRLMRPSGYIRSRRTAFATLQRVHRYRTIF